MANVPQDALKVPPAERERVRLAVSQLVRRKGAKPTVAAVKKHSGVGSDWVTLLLRLRRKGDMPDEGTAKRGAGAWWTDEERQAANAPGSPSLGGPPSAEAVNASQLRADWATRAAEARTAAEREALKLELVKLVALKVFSHQESKELRAQLSAIDPEPLELDASADVLVGREAEGIARAITGIVSDERRERLIALVIKEYEADVIEHGAMDTGG